MSSCPEAQAILKPLLDEYMKNLDEVHLEKVAEHYDPDATLVQVGKKAHYGREAIRNEFAEFDKKMGKSTNKFTNEHFQMVGNYIIYNADYEIHTEKMGVIKGKFSQVWRKSNDKYMIWHDEFTMD
ncbi:hypothetical protein RB195_002723 [Necator americanus]|uniref:DUF4440 domain-containing protein n=1 Tax=Necator americanus TaxID=51031 RepID=A0ABR1DLW5_NECAM